MRFLLCLLIAVSAWAGIVQDVRALAGKGDFAGAEKALNDAKAQGVTPEWILAHSWLGRNALVAKQYDKAEAYAAETRRLSLDEMKKRPLDQEPQLPTAFGASMEVHGQVLAAKGQRSEAVSFLQNEIKTYKATSIRTRLQKNLNLLTLEGQRPPSIETKEYLGPKPPSLAALKGKAVLVFLWAHWCGDCKTQAPILAKIRDEFASRGLVLIGPTQRYGYVARGEDATPAEELKYIEKVRREFYSALADMPVPVSEETFALYGASTTPTLVLLDRKGLVRMYHPGRMTYEELSAKLREVLGPS